jgi:glycosyltransferase involved in cell wall biosynthesis
MGVSVVLLTDNCERHLRACLESVRWADELVVLDGGSTDATRRILAEYTPVVHPQPADLIRAHRGNFDVARNVGFSLARHEWILVVDSDEEVSPALGAEIRAAIAAGPKRAYAVPRINLFWGHPSRLLGRDFQLRLFPRGTARYDGSHLDARPTVSCPVAHLEHPLVHHQSDSLARLLGKLHTRTSQRARVLVDDPPAERQPVIRHFYYTFRYYYREQGAAEDGALGVLLSLVYAAYPSLTELKRRMFEARRRLGWPLVAGS